jgi:hypothetical protein
LNLTVLQIEARAIIPEPFSAVMHGEDFGSHVFRPSFRSSFDIHGAYAVSQTLPIREFEKTENQQSLILQDGEHQELGFVPNASKKRSDVAVNQQRT